MFSPLNPMQVSFYAEKVCENKDDFKAFIQAGFDKTKYILTTLDCLYVLYVWYVGHRQDNAVEKYMWWQYAGP